MRRLAVLGAIVLGACTSTPESKPPPGAAISSDSGGSEDADPKPEAVLVAVDGKLGSVRVRGTGTSVDIELVEHEETLEGTRWQAQSEQFFPAEPAKKLNAFTVKRSYDILFAEGGKVEGTYRQHYDPGRRDAYSSSFSSSSWSASTFRGITVGLGLTFRWSDSQPVRSEQATLKLTFDGKKLQPDGSSSSWYAGELELVGALGRKPKPSKYSLDLTELGAGREPFLAALRQGADTYTVRLPQKVSFQNIRGERSEETLTVDVPLRLGTLLAVADATKDYDLLGESLIDDKGDRGRFRSFWTKVLVNAQSPAVASAAKRRLERSGLKGDELEAAKLIVAGRGTATFKDAKVDWTPVKPDLPPRAEVAISLAPAEIAAGEPLTATFKVTNTGKGPLSQLRAKLRCDVAKERADPRNYREEPLAILFGKIDPGATVERKVVIETDRSRPGKTAIVALVDWKEQNGYAPAEKIEAQVSMKGAARPELALACRAVDDGSGKSVGNGDGVVQKGEAIELRLAVKNTGEGVAMTTKLVLAIPELEGVSVFGEREQNLGDLAPGQVKEVGVAISVKPGFKGKEIPIQAKVSESSSFSEKREQDVSLRIDERAPRPKTAIDRPVFLTAKAPLLAGAEAEAATLGVVDAGSRLRGVGELEGFVEVEYGPDKKKAWLRRRDVSFEAPKVVVPEAAGAVVREFVKPPPLVVITSPVEGKDFETSDDRIVLRAIAKDPEGIASVAVLVDGVVVPPPQGASRDIGGTRAAKPGATSISVALDEKLVLAPGRHRIAVEATGKDGQKASAEVVVVRTEKAGTVVALVIGIDSYEDKEVPPLSCAEADAKALAEFLRKNPRSPVTNPDDVTLLLGPKVREIKKAIAKLAARASSPEDTAIFYFAGHGFSEGERYFLAGADTEAGAVAATAIERDELVKLWRDMKAQRKVFIADACHSGGLKGLRGENEIAAGLPAVVQGKGAVVLLAAREKQQSGEANGRGIFTEALVRGLEGAACKDPDHGGRVSARELAEWLDHEVPALARKQNRTQNPKADIDTEGEVFLTR